MQIRVSSIFTLDSYFRTALGILQTQLHDFYTDDTRNKKVSITRSFFIYRSILESKKRYLHMRKRDRLRKVH
jgi:hypothetical protein